MNATRARKKIRDCARQGRYVISGYCSLRLLQRVISEDDVLRVLTEASGCWLQANGRWKLEGETTRAKACS
jgi:hypothetical protein